MPQPKNAEGHLKESQTLELDIKVKKVIHSKRWIVLRMISKVEDFSKFMPNVKKSEVLQITDDGAITRWNVEFNRIPITWVERDSFDFPNFTVHFKAIEGDLRSLEGKWVLKDHPQGTEVEVTVKLSLGIPLQIEKLVASVVKMTIEQNFNLMLEAIDHRLITNRYRSFKAGNRRDIGGFAIVGHPYNFNHLVRGFKLLRSDFKAPSPEFLAKIFEITPSYKMFDIDLLTSPDGRTTHGCFIVCTFVPDMLDLSAELVFSKVVEACRIAERNSMGIVGLGGFTSIAGERFGKEISQTVEIPVTTGNTFTAALACAGIKKACDLMGIHLEESNAVIIGGAGDIGSGCAWSLGQNVRHLTLTARNKERLVAVRDRLRSLIKAELEITADGNEAVTNADIVICAASASQSIVDINRFKPGAVVCDVGYPKNISYSGTTRDDILIFSGGLTEAATEVKLGFDIGLPSGKAIYGCFAEAIILDLEGRYENFSYGRGNITPDKMRLILEMASRHRFELAPFFWGDRLLSDEDIANIRKRAEVSR